MYVYSTCVVLFLGHLSHADRTAKRQARKHFEHESRESSPLLWVGGFSDWNMKNGIEVCIWHNGMCFQRVEQNRAEQSTAEKSGLEQSRGEHTPVPLVVCASNNTCINPLTAYGLVVHPQSTRAPVHQSTHSSRDTHTVAL